MKKVILVFLATFAGCLFNSTAFAGMYANMVLNFHPNISYCQDFINSGALYMAVNPGVPESVTGKVSAIVNPNNTVALHNFNPGVTTIVPSLNEAIYCPAKCAIANQNINCRKACTFVVNNFYKTQTPTYAVPNGAIIIQCPTLTMSKYLNYPSYPYSNYPYNRP